MKNHVFYIFFKKVFASGNACVILIKNVKFVYFRVFLESELRPRFSVLSERNWFFIFCVFFDLRRKRGVWLCFFMEKTWFTLVRFLPPRMSRGAWNFPILKKKGIPRIIEIRFTCRSSLSLSCFCFSQYPHLLFWGWKEPGYRVSGWISLVCSVHDLLCPLGKKIEMLFGRGWVRPRPSGGGNLWDTL